MTSWKQSPTIILTTKNLLPLFALCRKNPFADLSFDASAWRQNRFSATTAAHLICFSTFEAENDVIAFWTCWWFHFSNRTAGIRVRSSPKAFELKVEPWRARTSQCFPSSLLWAWVKFELALQAPAISNNLELEKCQGHFHHSNNFAKLKPKFFNLDRAQKSLAMLLKTRLERAELLPNSIKHLIKPRAFEPKPRLVPPQAGMKTSAPKRVEKTWGSISFR